MKPEAYIKTYFTTLLISSVSLGASFLFPYTSQAACSDPSPLPSGFAAPCPVFSVSPASVSQSGTETLSASPQPGTDYIYTTVYIAKGTTWNPYTLAGNNAAPSYSSSQTSLTLSSDRISLLSLGTNYVVLWDWLWDATAQCYKGPGLNQCNTGQWRVQTFTLTSASYTYAQSAYGTYAYSQSAYTADCTNCNNYYVNVGTGSDSNDGLAATVGGGHGPWAAINHADSALTLGSGGTIVHVASGTYSSAVTTNKAGSTSARIRYVCDSQYGCKLNESSRGTIWQAFGAYTDIVGFDFDGTGHTGVTTALTVFAPDGLVQGNRFHDTASGCFTSQNAVMGSSFNTTPGHGNRYIGNLVYHNNCGAGHQNGAGNAQTALSMDAYDTAQDNIIMDQGSGYAVQVSHGFPINGVYLCTNETFVNNTIVNVDQGVILGFCNSSTLLDYSTISNNIVANVGGGTGAAIRVHNSPGCGSHNIYANNLMYGSMGYLFDTAGCPNTAIGTQSGSNSTTFVNYTGTISGDYHSKAGYRHQ